MDSIQKLYDYINTAYSKEDQLRLAAILMSPYSEGNKVVSNRPTASERQFDEPTKLTTPKVEAEIAAPVQKQEHTFKTEFRSRTKKIIQYSLFKNKVQVMRPKTIDKLRKAIGTVSLGYGSLDDSVISEIIDQMKNDNCFTINGDNLNWN